MMKKSLGMDQNVTGMLCYVLGWISGLAIILIEKDNLFVRFHAMQSIITFGVLTIFSILIGSLIYIFIFLASVVNIIGIALWVLLMVKAYQGTLFKLPVIGDLAEEWSRKFSI